MLFELKRNKSADEAVAVDRCRVAGRQAKVKASAETGANVVKTLRYLRNAGGIMGSEGILHVE